MKQFETLKKRVPYKSDALDAAVTSLWRAFYRRLARCEYECDRAIWIANRFPAWLGVTPGSASDDPMEEPLFCVSVIVVGLDEVRDDLRAKYPQEAVYKKQTEKIWKEYESWVNDSIRRTWESPPVRKMHAAAQQVSRSLRVFTTPIDDLHSHEVDKMKRLFRAKT